MDSFVGLVIVVFIFWFLGVFFVALFKKLFGKASPAAASLRQSGKVSSRSPRSDNSGGLSITITAGGSGSSRGSSSPKGKPAQWLGLNQSVTVQGYDLRGGLLYVGEWLPDSFGSGSDACLINPKLKVRAGNLAVKDDSMSYWPSYSSISAECRGAYLQWLACGRQDAQADIGYVFLFFYGLERRLFKDGQEQGIPDDEIKAVVEEVRRLLSIYGESSRSFRGYARNLLAMVWALYWHDKNPPDYLDFSDRACAEAFQVVLAQYVAAGKPIPAEVALQWSLQHPESNLRTPARRCAREFRELFLRRYHQQHGEGLLIKPNKTPLKVNYKAASPSFGGIVTFGFSQLPNPFGLSGPMKKISALVEECTEALEPYSRIMAKKDNDPTSLSALAWLPRELLNQAPVAATLKSQLTKVCESGPELMSIESLYRSFGQSPPVPINKKETESLTSLLDGLGFGIAPDPRFHHGKLTADGSVAVFPRGHGVDFRPSREFRTVGAILTLGVMVSQVDKDPSAAEEATLRQLIRDNRALTSVEQESLDAYLHWSFRTPQGTAGLKQKLADLSEAEKTAISHILITVAHADGRIDTKEIKQLEKLYTSLGLDKENVTRDLHTMAATEPVTVAYREADTSFAIPKPASPKPAAGFQLNAELIRIREEETRKVKGVLEEIFTDNDIAADVPQAPPASQPVSALASLDKAHQALFQRLVGQSNWDRAEIHVFCKELGLMTDGAMEALNEWAFSIANAPLIDDGDPVYIDLDLVKELTNV